MKKNSWVAPTACAAVLAALSTIAGAQSMTAKLSRGPASLAQRWGTDLVLLATVTGPCSSSPTIAGVATFVLTGASPVQVSPLTYNAGLPCSAGAFAWSFPFSPWWADINSDWQAFRSTSYTALAAQGSSNVLSLRFDPEFTLPSRVNATIATGAAGFGSCDGRVVEQVDREYLGGLPAPPPRFRTPLEIYRVVTSRCIDAQPQLVNMRLPVGFSGALVYDRLGSNGAWREAGKPVCGSSPTSPCFYEAGYRRFDSAVNLSLYGDAGGVQSFVAFWSPQAEVRGYDLQDMWWAGPSESGWGINIAKSGDSLFIAGFIYDADGKPTWFYMPNGQWDPDTLVWYGNLYSPQGARYDNYSANLFRLGASIGTGSISFSNTEVGHFDYTINQRSGGKSIGRYTFAPHDEPGKYTGIYWAGDSEQAGWGLSVSHQANTVFATWYTYGDDFAPTWFFMPAGQQTAAGVFSGELYRATGAAWAGMHYSGDSTKVTRVGTMELRFGADKPGTMTAVVNGATIVNPLAKFNF